MIRSILLWICGWYMRTLSDEQLANFGPKRTPPNTDDLDKQYKFADEDLRHYLGLESGRNK
mgnify:FL=1